jgi:hypothetical protein
MRYAIDITGKRFGRLVVVKMLPSIVQGKVRRAKCLCQCDCGQTKEVLSTQLKTGHVSSCGCLQKQSRILSNTKHGLTDSRLYSIWESMKTRCTNPKHKLYSRYGGRGINIDKEWNHSFESFYNWSINNGYSENLTLDRIDNNLGYVPNNCRWATRTEQSRNTCNNIFITYNEETFCATDWSRRLGGTNGLVSNRIKRGWSKEKAVSIPSRSVLK